MRALLLLVLGLASFACRGERTPPLVPGEGLRRSGPRGLELDPARTPIVPADCRGLLVKGEAGWSCGDPVELADGEARRRILAAEAALAEVEATATRAAERLASMTAARERLEGELEVLDAELHRRPVRWAAVTCVSTEDTIAAGLLAADHRILFAPGTRTGRGRLHCPVFGDASPWRRLVVHGVDPDGAAAAAGFTGALRRLGPEGAATTIASLDSSGAASVEFAHAFDFETGFYFVELELFRTDGALQPELHGFSLEVD